MDRLRAAVIDNRSENVRYRQNELQALHKALRDNADKLRQAITRDSHGDKSAEVSLEAEAEYSYSMGAVREFYSSLDFEKSIKDEYLLAHSADNLERRVGKGLVVIKPTTHTRLYSIVCPIAAAITAGNCVCLELEDTVLNVDQILKEILPQALDIDTFYISNTPLQEDPSTFIVNQDSHIHCSSVNQLLSHSLARAIAIVDRAADIEVAAKAIIDARFSFQGTSPYSPDIVIVNDFVKAKFTEACIKCASKFHSANLQPKRRQINHSSKKAFKEAEEKGQALIFGSTDFVLAEVRDKNSSLVNMKVRGCYLPILECTSLVDSLMSQKSDSTFMAAYIFSDPPTAKFLAQHIDAKVTYVNQIPLHLLIGPAAPTIEVPAPVTHRYNPEMFSSVRPQFISPPSKELQALEKVTSSGDEKLLTEIRKQAEEPLPKTGQRPGHAVGFFEQGALLGAGLFLTLFIPAMAYGSWVLGRSAWRLARK